MNITDRATVRELMTALTSSGAKAPKAVAVAHARTVKLTAAARDLAPGEGAVAVAVAVAVDAGRDPAGDPAVQRVLAAGQLANEGLLAGLDSLAFDGLRDACKTHADDVVNALRVPFAAAAEILQRCHDRLGGVPLGDAAAVVRLGGGAAETWADAQSASAILESVVSGWSGLGTFTRLVAVAPRHRVLRIAAADHETWQQHRLERGGASPWEALSAGLVLSLPSFTEFRERVEAIEEQARRAADQQRPVDTLRSHIAGREIRVPR